MLHGRTYVSSATCTLICKILSFGCLKYSDHGILTPKNLPKKGNVKDLCILSIIIP